MQLEKYIEEIATKKKSFTKKATKKGSKQETRGQKDCEKKRKEESS
jgi:hypothetical protein